MGFIMKWNSFLWWTAFVMETTTNMFISSCSSVNYMKKWLKCTRTIPSNRSVNITIFMSVLSYVCYTFTICCHANMSFEVYCKWKISVRTVLTCCSFGRVQSFVKMDKDSFLLTIIIEILYANDEINYFLSDIFNMITGDCLPWESK